MARRPHAACPHARDEQSTTIPAPLAALALFFELWVGEHAAPLSLGTGGRLEIRIGGGLRQRRRRRRLAFGLRAGRLPLAGGARQGRPPLPEGPAVPRGPPPAPETPPLLCRGAPPPPLRGAAPA